MTLITIDGKEEEVEGGSEEEAGTEVSEGAEDEEVENQTQWEQEKLRPNRLIYLTGTLSSLTTLHHSSPDYIMWYVHCSAGQSLDSEFIIAGIA